MMDSMLYGVFAILYILLLLWLLQGSEPRFVWTNVLYLLLLALVYDNTVIALGKWIGEGDFLYYLNYMRYVLHAFITPLLVIYAVATLSEANIKWAQRFSVLILAMMYTALLVAIEFFLGIWGSDLQATLQYGALRYETVGEASGPPVMVLLATVVLLICSLFLLLQRGWLWFFVGVVIMTIGSMIPFNITSTAMTNAFELCLMTTLVLTKKWLRNSKRDGFTELS